MKKGSLFGLAVVALIGSLTAGAQERERSIAVLMSARTRIEVIAKPGSVWIDAIEMTDYVRFPLDPKLAIIWADTATSLVTNTLPLSGAW